MSAEILRRAAAKMREQAEAATPGPWRTGDNQHIAGVGNPDGTCASCFHGEPTWVGERDINGQAMLAHVHEGQTWWEHGIYAERPDGHICVVNDTDEYGYMDDADAAHIAGMHPAVALAVADLLTVASVDWPENPEAIAVARAYLGEEA